MFYVLYNLATCEIHAASNFNNWNPAPDGLDVVVIGKGNADVYDWPNGAPNRCLYQGGQIVGNPALPDIQYQAKRALEYPAIAEQLDALWKGGQAMADMKADVDAVKVKNPK